MNCPRCGKSIPSGAAFCMHCGQAIVAARATAPAAAVAGGAGAATPALSQAYQTQSRRNATIAAVTCVLALLGALGLGIRTGVLRLGGKAAQMGDLKAMGAIPAPMLEKFGSKGPPVLEAQAVGMPQDVRDWLKHLEETERRKRLLTERQMTDLEQLKDIIGLGVTSAADVNDLTDPDKVLDKTPADKDLQSTIARMKPEWYALNDFFMSVPPPEECKTIAANYSTGLQQLGDTMDDIGKIVDSLNPMSPDLNSDIQAKKQDVYSIQQTHRETIDESFKKALYGVDEVCKKYHEKRWFDIDTSGGGSDILGKFMGG